MIDDKQAISWIASASYEELLAKWRGEAPGSAWHNGKRGQALQARLAVLRRRMPLEQVTVVSNAVGWPQGRAFNPEWRK